MDSDAESSEQEEEEGGSEAEFDGDAGGEVERLLCLLCRLVAHWCM